MRLFVLSVPVVLALGLSGCEKEESRERSAEPIASVDKAAAVDPALAKAMAQASAAPRAKRGQMAAAPGGPPPTGVFDPGGADKEAPRGSKPKITLGGNGSEPRVTLGPSQPKPGWKTQGTVQVVLQPPDPRQPALPVQITLALEAQKPKVSDAGTDGAPADAVAVIARVKSAEAGAAGVPAEITSRLAMLKGVKIEYLVAPDGSGTGYHFDLPSGANELGDYVRVLSDTLALVTLPAPSVPLGKGAFWMTTTREGVFGLDLVTYRMVKVEELEGDKATLSVGTKRYSAGDRFEFGGLPADIPRELLEFDAKSEGRLELKAGAPFPSGGEIGSLLAAKLGAPERAMMLQVQSRVALVFGDKSGAAPKSIAAPAGAH
jgi:hypothetical protein